MIEEEKPIEMLEERQPPLQPPPLLASPPPPLPPKVPPPPDNLFAELDLMFPINESSEPQSQHQLSHLDLATDVNLDDFRVVLNELDKTLQKPLGESAGKGMDERDLSSTDYQVRLGFFTPTQSFICILETRETRSTSLVPILRL